MKPFLVDIDFDRQMFLTAENAIKHTFSIVTKELSETDSAELGKGYTAVAEMTQENFQKFTTTVKIHPASHTVKYVFFQEPLQLAFNKVLSRAIEEMKSQLNKKAGGQSFEMTGLLVSTTRMVIEITLRCDPPQMIGAPSLN